MLAAFETVAKAVADPTRVRILKLLEAGEICVCHVTALLELAPATVSKHLAILKTAGLVQSRRDGKWVHYRLAEQTLSPYAPAFLALLTQVLEECPTIASDRTAALALAQPSACCPQENDQ